MALQPGDFFIIHGPGPTHFAKRQTGPGAGEGWQPRAWDAWPDEKGAEPISQNEMLIDFLGVFKAEEVRDDVRMASGTVYSTGAVRVRDSCTQEQKVVYVNLSKQTPGQPIVPWVIKVVPRGGWRTDWE